MKKASAQVAGSSPAWAPLCR